MYTTLNVLSAVERKLESIKTYATVSSRYGIEGWTK